MKKRLNAKLMLVSISASMLLSLQVTYAQEGTKEESSTSKTNKVLERFDKDNDKKISYDEAPHMMQKNFKRHDLNKDGFIEGKELDTLPKHPKRHKKQK